MYKKTLNGIWKITLCSSAKQCEAQVPVSDYNALLKADIIDDPFYGENEAKCLYIAEEDKIFERTFLVDEEDLKYKNIVLSCDMLDTLAEIFINEKPIAKSQNAYVPFKKNVKDFLVLGENSVKILFKSPVNYVKERQKKNPLPPNANGINGVPYIRKPACHFGWDWGINLPFSGIIKDIDLLLYNDAVLDFDVNQHINNGKATVTVDLECCGNPDVSGKIICPKGNEIPLDFKNNHSSVVIENPELWWTRELSGRETQPLYEIKINDISKKIGIRTVELNRRADEYGNNFQFVLNGVPVFAKGSNLIPSDAIGDRICKKNHEKTVEDAIKANFNMIRVWGGGYYADDDLCSLCDEKGILIWQDFMFACLMYPFYDEEFLNSVKAEVESNVKRMKSHPSLALWCGNNEIEFMFSYMPEKLKIVQWYKKFFYEILPGEIRKADVNTPYIETSPIGKGFRKNITGDACGDTHMWHVWHGSKNLKYYRKRLTRFCSEYGMESLPSIDCIRSFADDSELDLYSKTMLFHQKCLSGNGKMLYYLLERFYAPIKFDDLLYLTGVVQMECIRDATEHFRRHKGRCNGSLWWQYNDCWGAPSWSSVDYSGKWKPLMYASKQFNAPFTVSICDNKNSVDIFVLNDLLQNKNYKIVYGAVEFNGNVVFEKEVQGVSAAGKSEKAVSFSTVGLNKKRTSIFATLYCDDELICKKTAVLLPERKLALNKAKLSVLVTDNIISIKSNTFARGVYIDVLGSNQVLSQNGFDIEAGETVIVNLEEKAEPSSVRVKCVNNIEFDKSKFKRFLKRFSFSIKPENIANRIYYSVS